MFRLAAALSALVFFAILPPSTQDPVPTADDGRAGTVIDRQGLAVVQPTGRIRWTPLGARAVLLPGDDVRTSIHGANAIEVTLAGEGGGTLLIGPGSRIELGRRTVHLLRGSCEIDPGTGSVRVDGPGGYAKDTAARVVLSVTANETVELREDPRWLTGYRSSTSAEWMGSLLAQVDGRDVPLHVGYHKVDVVIRDQIAETTIEQSFVNSTGGRLEGVFRFPLPADASISGFGMWIGRELVEGDIVEKQRARAIYEDIKRRKKDPGLLEWSGGNLFTARVWPIEPHSEKRIRIRYTQVLPLEGTTFRYRSALRSELLRKHPVRELQVHVALASARGIVKVSSPNYEVQRTVTDHTATVEFDAEDFRPASDFELAIELADAPPLTAVDHTRDGEGWFMLMVQPPGADGATAGWQRELVPEGDPLDVVLLCDTSGSMNQDARGNQARFVEALLQLLGPQDRFALAACDRDVVWLGSERVAPNDDTRSAALEFLDGRPSLGWSDLDSAFAAAFERCQSGSLLIYVGDGIPTTGRASPQAFAAAIGARSPFTDVVCHAVATSSTYERVVLDAIAAMGCGSRREVGDDPAEAAERLLAEAAQPSLKNAVVRFEGLSVSRVYPAVLPNVPVGTQQIVLGRFLPGEGATEGRIVVEGQLGDEMVRYTRNVALGTGTTTNSFLPRLWARRHLDALLEQGSSPFVQEQIVAFSEEYGILTPYTSLLVLESDADRERYGVTRRVKMRDGEVFFAAGADQAATETLRSAMRAARSWRLLLRQQALNEIKSLGRELYGQGAAVGNLDGIRTQNSSWGLAVRAGRYRGPSDTAPPESRLAFAPPGAFDDATLYADADESERLGRLGEALDLPGDTPFSLDSAMSSDGFFAEDKRVRGSPSFTTRSAGRRARRPSAAPSQSGMPWAEPGDAPGTFGNWGFPGLAPADDEQTPERPEPAGWSAEAREVLRSLDRRSRLIEADLALDVRCTITTLDEHDGAELEETRRAMVWTAGTWATLTQAGRATQPLLQWIRDGQRNVVALGLGLGRTRTAGRRESDELPIGFDDWTTVDLGQRYRGWSASVAPPLRDAILTLTLTAPRPSRHVHVLMIDIGKRVPVRHEVRNGTRLESVTMWDDFLEVRGEWFARRAVQHGPDGGERRRVEQEVSAIDDETFAARFESMLAGVSGAVIVPAEDPELDTARENAHAGKATFADWFRLCVHAESLGRHQQAIELWRTAVALIEGRRGARWLKLGLLSKARRGEERLAAFVNMSDALANEGLEATVFRAEHLIDGLAASLGAHERLDLHVRLATAYRAAGPWADRLWKRRHAGLLAQVGEAERGITLREDLVAVRPGDLSAQLELAEARRNLGRVDASIAGLRAALSLADAFGQGERDALHTRLVTTLWNAARLDEARSEFETWTREPARTKIASLGLWSTLLHLGQVEAADRAALAVATTPGLDLRDRPEDLASIDAATSYLLGDGWQWSKRTLQPDFVPHLDALCRALLSTPGGDSRAIAVVNGPFGDTDRGRSLRTEIVTGLVDGDGVTELETEALLARLGAVRSNELDDDQWARLADALAGRASREVGEWGRTAVRYALIGQCDTRGDRARAAAVLRTWLADEAIPDTHPQAADLLIHRLADEEWSDARRDELLGLISRAVDPFANSSVRREALAHTSRFVADTLARQRTAALLGPVDELGKLPREERRQLERDADRTAEEELAGWLTDAAGSSDAALAPWLRLEALCFAVEAAQPRDAILESVRALLDVAAEMPADDALPRALRHRCGLILAHAATSRGATAEVVDAVLQIYTDRAEVGPSTLDWQGQTLRLLAALDRPEQMLDVIQSWLTPDRLDVRLRVARAKLLAEVGRVEPAIEEIERVRTVATPTAADLAQLADWYLVAGDDVGRTRAIDARFDSMTWWELRGVANAEYSRISRSGRGVPDDLDPTVLRALRVWLIKLDDPSDSIWMIRALYDSVKDHRILASLAHGLTGHTPERVYRLVGNVENLIGNVHEEATLDALASELMEARVNAATETDRRAIALAHLLIARRAMRVPNTSESHRDAAMAALTAVDSSVREKGTVPGEAVPLADVLAGLGELPRRELHDRRTAILTFLVNEAETGSAEQLDIARARARALWAQGQPGLAIDSLVDALRIRREATGGALPASALAAVDRLTGWWMQQRHYREAERWLMTERDAQGDADDRRAFEDRIDRTYAACLAGRGSVSLGESEALFAAAKTRLMKRLAAEPPWAKPSVVSLYCSLHRSAHEVGVDRSLESLRRFAAGPLPDLLDALPTLHSGILYSVADTLDDIGGPLDALRLTVTRCTTEPTWHERVGQDVWDQFAWRMASWREKCRRRLDDVEAPLRQLVLDRFERYLLEHGGNGEAFWTRGNRRYWAALTDDYSTVTRRVLELREDSPVTCMFTAKVIWNQLQQHNAAIVAMLALDARHPLETADRLVLVRWLQERKRWVDSLPHAKSVADAWPANLEAQLAHVRALGMSGRTDEARATIIEAEERLEAAGALDAGALAQLAIAAVDGQLPDVASPYFERAIREREQVRPSGPDGSIAEWYGRWAEVLAELDRTDEAIDAASAAIVRWGPNQEQRNRAIGRLEAVIASIDDLPRWVARYDAQVTETGLDAPVLRRAIGNVMFRERDLEGALTQYRSARDLEPQDLDTWQKVVATLDALGRPGDACHALFGAVTTNPRELQLIGELARRYQRLGDADSAERARSNLVEPLPHEPEGHRMLAKIRERTGELDAAVAQWHQVVRTDREDAEGWLALARAQLAAGDRTAARATIDEVLKRDWDARFGDVRDKAMRLLR